MDGMDDGGRIARQRNLVHASGSLWAIVGQHIARNRDMGWKIASLGENSVLEGKLPSGNLQDSVCGGVRRQQAEEKKLRIEPDTLRETSLSTFRGRPFLSILAAPDGSIWATTRSHIARFGVGRGFRMPVEIPTPPDAGQVQYLAFSPKGVLWATGPAKLYRYDGRNWKMFGAEDGLQGQTVSSLAAISDNEVWLAYND